MVKKKVTSAIRVSPCFRFSKWHLRKQDETGNTCTYNYRFRWPNFQTNTGRHLRERQGIEGQTPLRFSTLIRLKAKKSSDSENRRVGSVTMRQIGLYSIDQLFRFGFGGRDRNMIRATWMNGRAIPEQQVDLA